MESVGSTHYFPSVIEYLSLRKYSPQSYVITLLKSVFEVEPCQWVWKV